MKPLTKEELVRYQMLDAHVVLLGYYKNTPFSINSFFLIPTSSGFDYYTSNKTLLRKNLSLTYIMEHFDVFKHPPK